MEQHPAGFEHNPPAAPEQPAGGPEHLGLPQHPQAPAAAAAAAAGAPLPPAQLPPQMMLPFAVPPFHPALVNQQLAGGAIAHMLPIPPPPVPGWNPNAIGAGVGLAVAQVAAPPPAPAAQPPMPLAELVANAEASRTAAVELRGSASPSFSWHRSPGRRVTRPALPPSTAACMMLAGALENFYDAYLIESTGKSSPSTRRTDLSRFTRFVRWTAAETIEEFVRVVSVRETWKDYILQATRELGSPSSVINDATSITTGVRALEAKGPAAARAIDFKTIALWRNELLRPVRREKNAYNSSMMDRDAQEAAGVMPAGGFTELRDALVPALARAVQAAQEIDAGQPATDARLNHIAAMAIARLYVEVPTSRPGPIANLSVKEANALIETGFARLYGTKNPGEHPTADQTASPVVQEALTAYRDRRPEYAGPPLAVPEGEDASAYEPFWLTANGHPAAVGKSFWVGDRMRQAFHGTGHKITPTAIRRMTETITSQAVVNGVITSEQAGQMRITMHHSGRTAALYYIKRRRLEAAKSAVATFEAAIAHEDALLAAQQQEHDESDDDGDEEFVPEEGNNVGGENALEQEAQAVEAEVAAFQALLDLEQAIDHGHDHVDEEEDGADVQPEEPVNAAVGEGIAEPAPPDGGGGGGGGGPGGCLLA